MSTETQVDSERSSKNGQQNVEVQTTLSVRPDSAATSPSSPAAAPSAGSQWPPQQQHQQMLQLLLLQRQQQQQQRAPAGRPPNAPASPRSPASTDRPRKDSALEVTDAAAGLTLSVSTAAAATASSAFRPVLTTRGGNWSPSRRTQHEPRLPYFEVRDISGDTTGKRFFRPIADGAAAASATSPSKPPTTPNDDVFVDDRQIVAAGARVNQVPPAERRPEEPADVVTTTAKTSQTTSSRTTSEAPLPPAASKSKPSSQQSISRSQALTRQLRAHRSRTAELRVQRAAPVTSMSNSPASAHRQVPLPGSSRPDDEVDDDDVLFDGGSEAGSVTLSTASVRSRAKSDSSATHSLRSATSQPAADPQAATSSSSLTAQQDGGAGRRRSAGWAQSDRRPPHGGAQSLRTSPHTPSPSPLIVRKLKSAAELLRECNERRHQLRQRSSRPVSPSSSLPTLPLPVSVTEVPQNSHRVTGTPQSTANVVPPSTSAQHAKSHPDQAATSSPDTDSAQRASTKTTTSSTTREQCTPTYVSSSDDARPTETHPQQSSTITSETSTEVGAQTSTVGLQPERSGTLPGATDDVQRISSQSVVTTRTQTVDTARDARSKFRDTHWFPVPKIFKTPK